jgi:hypothetical protein
MQYVIQAGELARSFYRKNIVRLLHHADGSTVAVRIAAEIAQLTVADVVAGGAQSELVFHVYQCRGQTLGILARGAQHMECKALRRLLADARQAFELLNEAR